MDLSYTAHNKAVTTDGEIIDFYLSWQDELKTEITRWRIEIARIVELPPYCVFPNTTLESLLNVLPRRTNELWLVKGFSEKLIDTYGKQICELIDSFLKEKNIEKVLYGYNSLEINNGRIKGIVAYLGCLDYFQCENNENPTKEKTFEKPLLKVTCDELVEKSKESIQMVEVKKNNSIEYTCFECRYSEENGGCFPHSNICDKFEPRSKFIDKNKKMWPEEGDATTFRRGGKR